MSQPARELWKQQIANLDEHIRIVVLHPHNLNHHQLLSDLLIEDWVVYLRLVGKKLKKVDVEQQLDAVMAEHDISLEQVRWLILDECDRAEPKAFGAFLAAIVKQADTRLILSGRTMTERLLKDDMLRQITRFIPSDDLLLLYDYAQRNDERMLLEVRSFGSGSVFLDGRPIESWDGALPRSLFFYLIDRGMVTRNDIFDVFWPKLSIREATNVFHVTKRKISEVLGVDLTVYWSGFYRISPEIELSYDVVKFTEMVQDSVLLAPEEAAAELEQAIVLFQGVFLSSIDSEWVRNRREELFQMYSEALVSLAELRVEQENYREALGLYSRATRANPYREDLVMRIMDLYLRLDMPKDALFAYERLETALRVRLNVNPGTNLQELAKQARASL